MLEHWRGSERMREMASRGEIIWVWWRVVGSRVSAAMKGRRARTSDAAAIQPTIIKHEPQLLETINVTYSLEIFGRSKS